MGSGAACAWSDDSSGCLVAWGKTEIGTMLELLSHRYTLDVAMMVAAALLMTIKVCATAQLWFKFNSK